MSNNERLDDEAERVASEWASWFYLRWGNFIELADLQQEARLAVWEAVPRYRPNHHAARTTWLGLACRSRLQNVVKGLTREKRNPTGHRVGIPPIEEYPDWGLVEAQALARGVAAESWRVVEVMLPTMPATHRWAFCLHYLGGLTVAETATVLGVKRKTAASWAYRARAKLRRLLPT